MSLASSSPLNRICLGLLIDRVHRYNSAELHVHGLPGFSARLPLRSFSAADFRSLSSTMCGLSEQLFVCSRMIRFPSISYSDATSNNSVLSLSTIRLGGVVFLFILIILLINVDSCAPDLLVPVQGQGDGEVVL